MLAAFRLSLVSARRWGTILAIAIIYYITASLSQLLAIPPGLVSPVYPPSGIALSLVLLFGPWTVRGVWIGQVLAAGLTFWTNQAGLWPSVGAGLGIATGSTLQALAGGAAIAHWIGPLHRFDRAQQVFRFVAIEAVCCMIAPTFGVGTMAALGLVNPVDALNNWVTFWLGDLMGVLVVVPLILCSRSRAPLTGEHPSAAARSQRRSIWEVGAWAVSFGLVVWMSFGLSYPIEYLLIPLLVWAAFRFRFQGVAQAICLVSAFTIWGTVRGTSSFNRDTLNESLLLLQVFIGAVSVTTMVLAATITEREAAEVQLSSTNEALEVKVEERTADLECALQDLQAAQVRMIQSEQLSSLGTLAAGASYEIGNALNVLTGNLTYASDRCAELIDVVQLYRQRYPQAEQDLAAHWQEIDLDFIKSDLPGLMDSLRKGIHRIQNVTDILQDFATPHGSDCRMFYLHTSLDNILTLLKQRLKGRGNRPPILVRREYGDLSPFNAYPGPLNQALTHLLTNAIDAIEVRCPKEQGSGFVPALQVKTETQTLEGQSWAVISITDNGVGMSEAVRDRAFQPFFTTKPATKASGLGLALCQTTIVELHGGAIDCDSQPDQGTKVIIRLPLHRLPAATAPNPTVVSLSSPPLIPE